MSIWKELLSRINQINQTEESSLQHMNITMIYSLINLIKIENYLQKIIKGAS